MNTIKTDFQNEQEMIKHRFQELFQIQLQLEKYNDSGFYFHHEIKALIQIIDELMQFLMNSYEHG